MQLRVLTYNIHKCIGGRDRRYDPRRIRDVILHHEPDIVFLQEVDDDVSRSNGDRQFELLGELLGFRHRIWFPNVRVQGGGRYGNAILSRYPLSQAENVDLTVPPKKRRSALHARIRIRAHKGRRSQTLHAFNLHLGLSGFERKLQLRRLLNEAPLAHLNARTPIIVAGDLNDVWGTLGPRLLAPAGFQGPRAPVFTFPAFAPIRALDGIFTRGEIIVERLHRSKLGAAKSASDHLPLIAELKLPG
ncbi:MAG: endonuclease/exonuclease/phosphatase family protein [Deltaproteobacteria bacterium]|nr:endonuclease/exonuclease/phosphatase family protein [Deltaproteobacteria bacterium]